MQDLFGAIDAMDKAIVNFVQESMQTPILAAFFNFITQSRNWVVPLVLVWIWLLIKGGKRGRVAAVLMLPLFILSDFCTAKILKPFFNRPRPLGHGGFAFPSVHATNAFAVVTLLSIFTKQLWIRIVLFCIATLIAVSRVYIGVHYLTDILAGAMLGVIDAFIVYSLYILAKPWLERKLPIVFDAEKKNEEPLPTD